jgi:aconitate hydratase
LKNSFHTQGTFKVTGKSYRIHRLKALAPQFDLQRLPYSHRILLENLLRHEDGVTVDRDDIAAVAQGRAVGQRDIAFFPARILLQDFTGVPVLADLAAMRDAMVELGGDPARINPIRPADLVIDHSVQVDTYASADAFDKNAQLEMERNRERYAFLRWGQVSFDKFRVAPPDRGIVHQVNLEFLGRVVFTETVDGVLEAFPDTLVGTDSHTPMINGLGVLGWGVGGIEAEAALLGEPLSILTPPVTGVRLSGHLREGVTATDLVLTLTETLRGRGVVGHFVEFVGPALDYLSLADRATIANMTPEFGATSSYFPIDAETLNYLRLSNRDSKQIDLVEGYAREQGLFRDPDAEENIRFDDFVELDLGQVEPSLAGPSRPQDRIPLSRTGDVFRKALATSKQKGGEAGKQKAALPIQEASLLRDGSVVIAAITSCTNTSNPAVMVAAGLLARNARRRGLHTPMHVKTSLAPGSLVVMEYLRAAGLLDALEALGFHLAAFGCTTCIGNSGPLSPPVSQSIQESDLQVCAVLSGNRNFEGRIHQEVAQNYLASPPLVVAFALAGHMDLDLTVDPLAMDENGDPVFLRDIWPSNSEVQETMAAAVTQEAYKIGYQDIFSGSSTWNDLPVPTGVQYVWDADSTYIRPPPFTAGLARDPGISPAIRGARVLVLLGDTVTTDHISPAGSIAEESPAGRYLEDEGVPPAAFNAYGARRGNHEVMIRGTFGNVRLQNRLTPQRRGGWTLHLPDGEEMPIYDAARRYEKEGVPLLVVAGREYGTGSSRDWAAKGTLLLGVRAVLAEGFERIHRTNLVGMGVAPLQFMEGENAASLGLTGQEIFDLEPLGEGDPKTITIKAKGDVESSFTVKVRIDTPREWAWYKNGGVLPFVLRRILAE